ncbi:sterigmatocystin 8-O-methyltransferase [Aspergillus udagawae]|uniref:Sterigmatocystin 8-O-methyltransferase n=1 Tax=Aspergillus udagawae TaxID=91492 RepID=A0A8H3XPK9_9EURO|nr:sterigmatocystin 8-O-methyltransferase [Aspergillus udagawae]
MQQPNGASLDQEIVGLVDRICQIKQDLLAVNNHATGSHDFQRKEILKELRLEAHRLMLATQEPQEAFWELIRRCSILSPIKVAQDIGVFRYLQNKSSATAKELAAASGAEESLIVRVLRPLVADHLLSEMEDGAYAVSRQGSIFAVSAYEEATSFAIEFLPVVLFNPSFFRQYGHREPRSHDDFNTPLAAYFQKPGYGFFDYLRDHPSIQKLFIASMQAHPKKTNLSCSVYDYQAQLRLVDDEPSSVAIVDVGGSRGELLQEIRSRYPQLKGRMIVQDLASTFQSMSDSPAGVELMVHDIFIEQPVKGAAAYHLKRILHDWSDDKSRIILRHLVSAMDAKRSKILIMDAVLPSTNLTLSEAMSDHSMLTFGGKERSENEWKELLSSVGLEIVQIYRGPEPEALLECRKVETLV